MHTFITRIPPVRRNWPSNTQYAAPHNPATTQDRRAINEPLPSVTSGRLRSLTGDPLTRSAPPPASGSRFASRGHLAVLAYSTEVQQRAWLGATSTVRHRVATCLNDRHRPAWR
jgi:hypothetical protein